MKKLLSVCIGCNKNGEYFTSALQSIIALLEKNSILSKSEILICNDSEVESGDFLVAKKYKQNYPKLFKLFDNKKNMGIAYTYNFMLNKAKGDFFMAFDSDDIIADFDICCQLDFLRNNDKYVGSYGLKKMFNNDKKQICVTGGQCDLYNFRFYCNHNAMILKTKQAVIAGGYRPHYLSKQVKVAPDVAMWIGMFIYKDLYFSKQIRCYGRAYEDSHSQKNKNNYFEQIRQIVKDVVVFYLKNKKQCSDNLKIISQGLIRKQYDQNYQQILFLQEFKQQILFSKYIFPAYVEYLKNKGRKVQIVSAILYGLLYNDQLKQFVANYCLENKFISKQVRDFSKLNFLKFKVKILSLDDDQWFNKFF